MLLHAEYQQRIRSKTGIFISVTRLRGDGNSCIINLYRSASFWKPERCGRSGKIIKE